MFLLLRCCHLSVTDRCRDLRLTWAQDTGLGRLIFRLTTHIDVETVDSPGLSWYWRVPGTLVDEVNAM